MVLTNPTIIELDMGKLEDTLGRVKARVDEEDFAMLQALADSYIYLTGVVGDKKTSIARLRKMLFGAKTEKTATVLGQHPTGSAQGPAPVALAAGDASTPQSSPPTDVTPTGDAEAKTDSETTKPDRAKGHGRHGADAYTGAEKIDVPHSSLQPGDPCPACETGTLYDTQRPGVVVRLVGQPPVGAKIYSLQKLRCNPCGAVFTAALPGGVDAEAKCDATVGSMIALQKYGMGMPFQRSETFQADIGVPLAASTQWDIVAEHAEHAEPAFEELVRQGAQGDVLYHDDTTVKILAMMERTGSAKEQVERGGESVAAAEKPPAERRGLFTTGIVAQTRGEEKIALFLSGHQHAGENLKDVLARRAAELPPPIQMCDALSRNMPKGLKTIVSNCLAHGRRKFVEVVERFPEECRHVLESLSVVYHNDEIAKQRNLSPQERLLFHQAQSGPVMEELHAWFGRQFDDRLVEPNSALGASIAYMLRHWPELTLFLRVAGAPLDNNLCERALKMAIRHRKNSLFYRTPRGAHVGDIFMSLIHTCRLCGANPFDYLTELERHAEEVASHPGAWMPWNYRQTLTAATAAISAAP